MRYMGSKAKIAKDILPIMLKDIGDRTFVDLFTGGGNLLQFVEAKNIIANDINPYTIAFLKRLKDEGADWLPKNNKEFTEQHYKYVKNNKDKFLKSVLGHVGYNLSFGGKWFGGWCRGKDSKGKCRDYVAEQYLSSVKQYNNIKDKNIVFSNKSYEDVEIPKKSIIYCDIPYKNTTKYSAIKQFDYDKFYNYCKRMKEAGHTIYISEYSMPEDFTLIWQKEVRTCLNSKGNSDKRTEKLFVVKD